MLKMSNSIKTGAVEAYGLFILRTAFISTHLYQTSAYSTSLHVTRIWYFWIERVKPRRLYTYEHTHYNNFNCGLNVSTPWHPQCRGLWPLVDTFYKCSIFVLCVDQGMLFFLPLYLDHPADGDLLAISINEVTFFSPSSKFLNITCNWMLSKWHVTGTKLYQRNKTRHTNATVFNGRDTFCKRAADTLSNAPPPPPPPHQTNAWKTWYISSADSRSLQNTQFN
jgi:hypothetical protein